ncbi:MULTISPECIES: ABC transporter ATP-binding protein [unclassified Actinomyces]|uniref:ABC transporter ATP-binding protein n=1 Tax=unclassified Actinomyces TaxID=2609248 RepID=UPI000D59B565|nr:MULTISPECIES: ABC transporter ATP-binding protein [unclassified Actinomyces]RAX21078.1 ABC transporter ATP-binding protein [Actinomyces sp. Z3]
MTVAPAVPAPVSEPAPAASGLCVRGLRVVYPATRGAAPLTAVDAVDLDVPRGQILALLGASGSGKSSLLRAVAGLEDIAAGTVTWDGDDVVPVPVHRRGFGLMFQDGQLFPFRDVAGNIAYGLAGLPRPERARRVEEVLDVVGLPGYGDRAVTTLSGGQAQRVVLARALAPRPRLLLLDEPLSALDRALREQLATDLRTILKAQGTTALYVTHDQDEAMTVADRVGVMASGRLLRLDTPERLWADPGSARVARFLGFAPLLDADAAAHLGWADLLAGRPGELLALAPGALAVAQGDAGNADDGGTPGGGAATSGPGGYELSARARVAAVRMRGGRRVVEVEIAGEPAMAVLADGDAEPVRAGQEITVRLDRRRTAVVRA